MNNSNLKYIFLVISLLVLFGIIILFSNMNNSDENQNFHNKANETYSNSNANINTNINTNANTNTNTGTNTDSSIKEAEISSFSTEIKDNSPGRLQNIRITCDIINGTILEPSQTFSFNELVGQPSEARGYQEATVIIDGEHETGIGGR